MILVRVGIMLVGDLVVIVCALVFGLLVCCFGKLIYSRWLGLTGLCLALGVLIMFALGLLFDLVRQVILLLACVGWVGCLFTWFLGTSVYYCGYLDLRCLLMTWLLV